MKRLVAVLFCCFALNFNQRAKHKYPAECPVFGRCAYCDGFERSSSNNRFRDRRYRNPGDKGSRFCTRQDNRFTADPNPLVDENRMDNLQTFNASLDRALMVLKWQRSNGLIGSTINTCWSQSEIFNTMKQRSCTMHKQTS